jgi:hypothetical protein
MESADVKGLQPDAVECRVGFYEDAEGLEAGKELRSVLKIFHRGM